MKRKKQPLFITSMVLLLKSNAGNPEVYKLAKLNGSQRLFRSKS